jgi:tripartite tricarboxylate transporter family receptor
MVVLGEYAAHDVFVDIEPESERDLLGDAYTAELRIAVLQFHDRGNELRRGTFRTRFAAMGSRGKEQPIFPIYQCFVEFQ